MKNFKMILLLLGLMFTFTLVAQESAVWNGDNSTSPIWGESSSTNPEYFAAPDKGQTRAAPGGGGDAIGVVTPIHDTFLILFYIAACYGAYSLRKKRREKQLR
ncbi:MAG: hypothetical protein RR202_02175 [Bacteroidales bacterium]